ncbi:MAG: lytic murein transglycosylase [Syntrophus sp. (in: bacteria)]
MKKVNIVKKMGIAVAALFIVACLVSNIVAAESKVVWKKEVTNKEIKKDKTGKKKGKGTKRNPVVMGSIEKRKAALKVSFRRAGISQDDVDDIFSDERIELYYSIYTPPVLKEGEKKKKKLSYFDEEFGLFKPESIESGKRIIADNKELFGKIESFYGVPANYIVSIIRIETDFKKHLGKYSVFNALYTMCMLDKRAKRVEMANRELVAWVRMCKRKDMDPFDMKGSWAGAFGIPQFMPSSYVIFAVDYNGDGKTDLYDYPDAFASIANYLHHMGWKTGNEKKMRRAVYSYNHEKAYVNAVFAYAEMI